MKLSLFTDDMTFYIQLPLHSKESKRQLLQLISEFSLLHYNIKTKILYLYISSKKLENQNVLNFIYIGIKNPKFLGINLTKAMQDLNESHKTLLRETKTK